MSTSKNEQKFKELYNIIGDSRVLIDYFLATAPKIIEDGYYPSQEELTEIRKAWQREQGLTV